MKLGSGISKEFAGSFLLDEAKLRKVSEILKAYGDKSGAPLHVIFNVESQDGRFFQTNVIDEVLSHDNASGRAIELLAVDLVSSREGPSPSESAPPGYRDRDEGPTARMMFRTQRSPRVLVMATGPNRDWCFLLVDELTAQTQRMLLAESKLLTSKWLDRLLGLAVVVTLMTLSLRWGIGTDTPALSKQQIARMSAEEGIRFLVEQTVSLHTSKPFRWFLPGVMGGVLFFFLMAEVAPLSRLFRRMNQPVFYWGDAAVRHDKRRRLTSQIFWGGIAAFAISVIAGIATAFLLK